MLVGGKKAQSQAVALPEPVDPDGAQSGAKQSLSFEIAGLIGESELIRQVREHNNR
jgi:hypothetical protein